MNKAALERYRQQIEKLKSRMRSDATAVADQARTTTGGQAAGELSNAPMYLADSGTEEFLHDLNATLVENEEYLANEVRAALQRIDEGTYGRCEKRRLLAAIFSPITKGFPGTSISAVICRLCISPTWSHRRDDSLTYRWCHCKCTVCVYAAPAVRMRRGYRPCSRAKVNRPVAA